MAFPPEERENLRESRRLSNEPSDAARRPTRSEVDDYEEPSSRLPSSGRGGFVSDESPREPGGTTGEHSGQRASSNIEREDE